MDQAFKEFQNTEEKIKQSFWITMGNIMDLPPKQLHDYYHNTWSKRFFDDLNPHKIEIQEMIEEIRKKNPQMTKKEMIRTVIREIQTKYSTS